MFVCLLQGIRDIFLSLLGLKWSVEYGGISVQCGNGKKKRKKPVDRGKRGEMIKLNK